MEEQRELLVKPQPDRLIESVVITKPMLQEIMGILRQLTTRIEAIEQKVYQLQDKMNISAMPRRGGRRKDYFISS